MFTSFIMGFLAKTVASLDDTLLRIPVFSVYTKTLKGKVYFLIGTMSANTVVLAVALLISNIVESLPFVQEIAITLIFLLAILIYFEIGFPDGNKPKKLAKTGLRFWIGFFTALASLIDDMLIMLPLFLIYSKLWIIVGALTSATIGAFIVFYFAKPLQKVKYKKEIASISLACYGILLIVHKIWFA